MGWSICGHAGNAPSAGVPPVATLLVFIQLGKTLLRTARDAGFMPAAVHVLNENTSLFFEEAKLRKFILCQQIFLFQNS